MLHTPPRKPRRARAFGMFLLVVLLAFAGFGIWVDQTLDRAPVLTDYPGRPAAGKGTTWLLVGSDNRDDLGPDQQVELATGGDMDSARTDTIILVHVPALGSSRSTAMVSIPRDSYVPVPGYGQDKINAAFAIGGPRLLVQAVEGATGIRVDHYAELGFGGFANVVDAMGGVPMCLSEPMDDPLAGISLSAGCQKLDGRNALGFVRSRATPRADLDRMVHQREFMSALLRRATDPRVSLDPVRWVRVEKAFTDAMTVDSGAHVWDLARLAWALRGSTVATTVPIAGFVTNDSGDVVSWDQEAASRLFKAMAADEALPDDTLQS